MKDEFSKNLSQINGFESSFSSEELLNRIRESENDIQEGRFITQEELEKISDDW